MTDGMTKAYYDEMNKKADDALEKSRKAEMKAAYYTCLGMAVESIVEIVFNKDAYLKGDTDVYGRTNSD